MGAYIARQPNGKLCRFSSVVDTVTDWDMTEQEYIDMCKECAESEAKYTIKHYCRPFEDVIRDFVPRNETRREFKEHVRKSGYTGNLI